MFVYFVEIGKERERERERERFTTSLLKLKFVKRECPDQEVIRALVGKM